MWLIWSGAGIFLVVFIAAVLWVEHSVLLIPHRLPLPSAVCGELRSLSVDGQRLSYYCTALDSNQRPLLLVHSVHAAASSWEVRPLYEHYSRRRPVYALDLPGFGRSPRVNCTYTARLMTDAVQAIASEVRKRHDGHAPDALAIALSSEYLARAAAEDSQQFNTLSLVNPSGFGRSRLESAILANPDAKLVLRRILSFEPWDRAFFDLLTTKPMIRFYLQRKWDFKQIDEDVVEHMYKSAHQYDAQHPFYSLISGYLSSLDTQSTYFGVSNPLLIVYDPRQCHVGRFLDAGLTKPSNWDIRQLAAGQLPFWRDLREFVGIYDAFLAGSKSANPSSLASHVIS